MKATYGLLESQHWKESEITESFPIVLHVGKLCPGTQNLLMGLGLESTLVLFLSHHPAKIDTMSSY